MFDFDEIFQKKRPIIWVFLFVILIGIYMLNLMFGNRSFSKLIDLQNSFKSLSNRVEKLKEENARLQREYFELKELEDSE